MTTFRGGAMGFAVALCLMAAGCGGPAGAPEGAPVTLGEDDAAGDQAGQGDQGTEAQAAKKVDPRQGGFEVGFGEWAVTLEAPAIRPGKVTFVVTNGGKRVHGFEMESEGQEGDSSGSGSGEEFKIETQSFDPGETIRIPMDLAPGLYKVECWVDGHDDLGMEIMLEVRPDAPLVRQAPAGGAGGDAVTIEGFAFDPETIQVEAGTEVSWTNQDPESHTVTATDDSFDSGVVDQGKGFSVTVDQTGTVTYFCAIHPAMEGAIEVT